MIIDFHTHAFPEKIAERALASLKVKINREPNTFGTTHSLAENMKKWGIDYSVVCNIATNPAQTFNVNNFAIDTNKKEPSLIALGSVHPEYDDVEGELIRLKKNGIRGIKVHPDYMGHDIDERCFDTVFDVCAELDLFVITHAGFDVCSPDHVHATPDMILRVIERHPILKLIAAHFGANMMYDEVFEKLCGRDLWIDTSLAYIENVDKNKLIKILKAHDPGRILYGSDAPWCPPDENVRYIETFGLGSEINEKIFEKNARHLLNL